MGRRDAQRPLLINEGILSEVDTPPPINVNRTVAVCALVAFFQAAAIAMTWGPSMQVRTVPCPVANAVLGGRLTLLTQCAVPLCPVLWSVVCAVVCAAWPVPCAVQCSASALPDYRTRRQAAG